LRSWRAIDEFCACRLAGDAKWRLIRQIASTSMVEVVERQLRGLLLKGLLLMLLDVLQSL
jgi:hypothetical protein